MLEFKEYIIEAKSVEQITKDIEYQIKRNENPSSEQLLKRKVINKLKEIQFLIK